MSKSTVEIDFFQMEKQNASSKPPPSSPDGAGAPFRGIQSLVSRIHPQLLKTVMASGAAARGLHEAIPGDSIGLWGASGQPFLSSRPSSPTAAGETSQALLAPLPVLNSASRYAASHCPPEMAPLTIFYNGTVAAFDVPPDQAEIIIKMAETGIAGNPVQRPGDSSLLDGDQLEGDLPIARRKSLQRFLEKRKERLASASPYHEGTSHPC